MGRPAPEPGEPPGDEAEEWAMRILGVIRVLSDKRRLLKALATRKKLLPSCEAEELPNHQLPRRPVPPVLPPVLPVVTAAPKVTPPARVLIFLLWLLFLTLKRFGSALDCVCIFHHRDL